MSGIPAKSYKYFISYSFINEDGQIRFGNCFTTVKCKIQYTSVLETITKELESKLNVTDLVIINFQLVGEYK